MVIPPLNFDATNMQNLINWETVKLSEPLLTTIVIMDKVISCLNPLPPVGTQHLAVPESRKWLKKLASQADYLPLFDTPLY